MKEPYQMDSAPPRETTGRLRSLCKAVSLSTWLGVAVILLLYIWSHFTLNVSPSLPIGIYQLTHQPVTVHSEVMLRFGLKQVVAKGGNLVEFAPDGIRVSGQLIPNSAPVKGYPHFPFGKYITPPNELVCLGDNPYSWDSRYAGFFVESLVYSTVKPVWTR